MAIGNKLILEQSDSTHSSPIEPGKLLIKTDEGNLYIDTDNGQRVRVGGDVIRGDVPLAPIDGKLYYDDGNFYYSYSGKTKRLYTYDEALNWHNTIAGCPIGTILPWLASANVIYYEEATPPSGWELCDGRSVVDRTLDPDIQNGDSVFFGDRHSGLLNAYIACGDSSVYCAPYIIFSINQESDGSYTDYPDSGNDADLPEFLRLDRVRYLYTGNEADHDESLGGYVQYTMAKPGYYAVGNFKLSDYNMLDESKAAANAAALERFNPNAKPFFITDDGSEAYELYRTDNSYMWWRKVNSSSSRYVYTPVLPKRNRDYFWRNPVPYHSSSNLSASSKVGEASIMVHMKVVEYNGGGLTWLSVKTPDLRNYGLWGASSVLENGQMLSPVLPNIKGEMNNPFAVQTTSTSSSELTNYRLGAIGSFEDRKENIEQNSSYYSRGSASANFSRIGFDASKSNPIYQDGNLVRPNSYGVNFIMRVY